MTLTGLFGAAWVTWLAWFIGWEAAAFMVDRMDLTFSEFTWRWEGTGWTASRYAVAAIMIWATAHLVLGLFRLPCPEGKGTVPLLFPDTAGMTGTATHSVTVTTVTAQGSPAGRLLHRQGDAGGCAQLSRGQSVAVGEMALVHRPLSAHPRHHSPVYSRAMTHGEARLQAEAEAMLTRAGVLWHHCPDSRRCRGPRGFPDLLALVPTAGGGRGLLAAELKQPGERRGAGQARWGYGLAAAGARYALVTTPAELAAQLRAISP